MVDIVITAGSVVKGSDAVIENGNAGETITAGQWVYRAAATGLYMKSDSNSATAEARAVRGVALNGGSINQPIAIQKAGSLTMGGTLTPGVAYYLSDTPGGMAVVADVGAGEYSVALGIASSATVFKINITASGVSL